MIEGFGPVSAAAVALVVALVEMVTVSHTGIWGFLMNFIATASFCCVACFVYKKHHTMKGAVIGLIGGVRVYQKFSSGDPDTSKTASSWFGACIFLIVAATILRSFFL